MRIAGKWQAADDGGTRPVVEAQVRGADGILHTERFLIDSGADRTVFRAHLLEMLDFPVNIASEGSVLQGIGGLLVHRPVG
jgi:hypothetical protein